MEIIPRPLKILKKNGVNHINRSLNLRFNNQNLKFTVNHLHHELEKFYQFHITYNSADQELNYIEFCLENTGQGSEGYILEIYSGFIKIAAEKPAGIFYAVQTLLQIMLQKKVPGSNEINLNCCRIEDRPRFSWRGMHLDVSRHFFGIDFIKRYLDLLALHKLNRFHWHLTDDNGWRIEIKKYPLLTEICSWRKDLEHIPWNQRAESNDPGKGLYGGFYSQKDIRNIVEYAAERFIEVIPEIEMPGHSSEVFAAYPEFSCQGKKLTVASGGLRSNPHNFCPGKDETLKFLQDILTEVIELFPSRYIHLGGDEVNKTIWKECPYCQQRIRKENLRDETELQGWFANRIAAFLNSKGRNVIVWDEVIAATSKIAATVMCWRGDGVGAAQKAASARLNAIMCPNNTLYFDWKENPGDKGAFGVTSLQDVYNYEPVPDLFSAEESKHILGAQGNVWTEWMADKERVEYMILPRMTALAEVVWSDIENRNFADFSHRLQNFKQILRQENYNFDQR